MVIKQTSLDLNGPILEFVEQPQSSDICSEDSRAFIGIATVTTPDVSTGTLSYRWYAEGYGTLSDGQFLGATIAGSATTTLTVAGAKNPGTNGVKFYVGVDYIPSAYSQPVGSAVTVGTARSTGNAINEPLFSDKATLTVRPNIVINRQPSNVDVGKGETVIFSVSAELTDGTKNDLSYRWQLNGNDLSDGGGVSGSSTPTLSISASTVGTYTISVNITHPTACNSPLSSRSASLSVRDVNVRSNIRFESISPDNKSITLQTWDLSSQGAYTYPLPSGQPIISFPWTISSGYSDSFYDVKFLNGYFFATADSGVYISGYGQLWTKIFNSFQPVYSIAYGNGVYIAVSNQGIYYSFNAANWAQYDYRGTSTTFTDISYGGGFFIISDRGGTTIYRTKGPTSTGSISNPVAASFSLEPEVLPIPLSSTVYNGSFWLGVGFETTQRAVFYKSVNNGDTWTFASRKNDVVQVGRTVNDPEPKYDLYTQNDGGILFGEEITRDGVNWSIFPTPIGGAVLYGYSNATNQLLAIIGSFPDLPAGQFALSTGGSGADAWRYFSGATWPVNSGFRRVAYGNGKWVVLYGTGGSSTIITNSPGLSEVEVDSLLSFFATERDLDITLDLYAEKGLDNGNYRGGQGGTSTIRFTARRNEEYVILGYAKGSERKDGGGIFVYRKGTLIAACGSGGNAGSSGNGGNGGGVNVEGANGSGTNGGIGGRVIEPSSVGIWGSASSANPLGQDQKANAPERGRIISCPRGNYWISRGFSPCSDVGSTRFISEFGDVITSSAIITRGFKEGYAVQETSGLAIGNGGNGGEGAEGGNGGQNTSGGGGGSGYASNSISVLSTAQGGNIGTPRVVFKLYTATEQNPPSYTIIPSFTSIYEGEKITFSINTTNVADGTILYYVVANSTTNSNDLSSSSGSFVISSGVGSFEITALTDSLNENTETFSVQIKTGSVTGTTVATSPTLSILPNPPQGQAEYTSPGTYSWIAPPGITSVSVVAVGAGGDSMSAGSFSPINPTYWGIWGAWGTGGGGGGLGWKNNIPVTPGQLYTVVVGSSGVWNGSATGSTKGGDSYFISRSTVCGYGGGGNIPSEFSTLAFSQNFSYSDLSAFRSPVSPVNIVGAGGTFVGDGGGNGGDGGLSIVQNYTLPLNSRLGGGGAGGYSGNGGSGGNDDLGGNYSSGQSGSGGAGGGGGSYLGFSDLNGSSGGGVGILGEGDSGSGAVGLDNLQIIGGGGGSGGSDGPYGYFSNKGGTGDFGGGAAVQARFARKRPAGNGAVRIIWGSGRAFPSTNTGNL